MTPTSIAEANLIYDRAVARAKERVGNNERAIRAELVLMVLAGDRDLDAALQITAKPAPRHCIARLAHTR